MQNNSNPAIISNARVIGAFFLLAFLAYGLGSQLFDSTNNPEKQVGALLIIAIVSAILTPPDVVSQIMMMFPLFLLYELGIWLVVFSQRVSRRKE